jgi:predicted nucleotidyltransferase
MINLFFEEHIEVLSQLLAERVEFLLIGGYAVIAHGYMRTTGDLDIWVKPDNENRDKLIKSFSNLGYNQESTDYLHLLDFTDTHVFSVGTQPQKIEFLTKVNLLDFESSFKDKKEYEFDGLVLPFVNYNDLVLMKMTTGRAKDKADVEELGKIKRNKMSGNT